MTKWAKVEYGEGTIEALAEMGIDAEKEVNRALAKDRIQQLALQAGAETWSRAPMRAVTGLAFTDENLEKFAELIVRECAEIAKTAEPWRSDDLILKHFGLHDEG